MGALEFEPEFNDDAIHESVNMSSLATLASKIYNDRDAAVISPEDSLTMKKLIYLGTSAGGMRPKAVIAYNLETEEFRSGQVDLPENFKQYIIKFKEADDSPTTEIEMVYSEMAKAAGINMMPCFLKEIDGRNHFVTERFDRKNDSFGEHRIHMLTAAALLELDFRQPNMDYHQLMKLTKILTRDNKHDIENMYRRMCFNVFAHNRDDHSKNFTFIYDENNDGWRLSPAYDLTYSTTYYGEHTTTVDGNGRNPGIKELAAVGTAAGMEKDICTEIAYDIEKCVKNELNGN
jgi:serine/threonine-protein kinase HipA